MWLARLARWTIEWITLLIAYCLLAMWFHSMIDVIGETPLRAVAVALAALGCATVIAWIVSEGVTLVVVASIVFTLVGLSLLTLVDLGVPRTIVAWGAVVVLGTLVAIVGQAVLRAGSFRELLDDDS
jgi:hypothetical protein